MFSITLPTMVFYYEILEGKVFSEAAQVADPPQSEGLGLYTIVVASFSVGQVL